MNKTVNLSVHRHNIHQWISDFGVHILAIVLSVLRSTDSDYTFGIFKLFWYQRRALLIIHVRYYPCIYTNKGGYCIYHRSRQFLFVVLNPDKISTISKYIDHFTTYNDQLTITVNKNKYRTDRCCHNVANCRLYTDQKWKSSKNPCILGQIILKLWSPFRCSCNNGYHFSRRKE